MQTKFLPEGGLLGLEHNKRAILSVTTLSEAAAKGEILEGFATGCDAGHNLIVNLGEIKGVIPRNDGAIGIAEGTVRDIALISRVGKAVCFTVEGFTRDGKGNRVALLSRRNAQQQCLNEYIRGLAVGDIVDARVTHLESFGAFCDIGCGLIALLPIDSISVSRISHPADRFKAGDCIKAVIKSKENGKITLSMKELLGTWQENADCFSTGETVSGMVRSVETYGIFVELLPNLAGLAESKSGVKVGEQASVYIKSILPEKMKVKLIIIDSFEPTAEMSPPKYYINGTHIDSWRYSPEVSNRCVESRFI
jgi:small subunit ribosomal protein S1